MHVATQALAKLTLLTSSHNNQTRHQLYKMGWLTSFSCQKNHDGMWKPTEFLVICVFGRQIGKSEIGWARHEKIHSKQDWMILVESLLSSTDWASPRNRLSPMTRLKLGKKTEFEICNEVGLGVIGYMSSAVGLLAMNLPNIYREVYYLPNNVTMSA